VIPVIRHVFHNRSLSIAVAGIVLLAFVRTASAQTEPRPAAVNSETTGLLTRSAFSLNLAGMQTEDPRFSLVERSRADLDLVGYGRGRVNFFIDTELVMGSERRAFDLNQANIIFEMSASYRVGAIEAAGVVHHASRHVVDREFDRVPAWHTVGARMTRVFVTPQSSVDISAEYGHIVQHTFVDYAWTSQLTLRIDRTLRPRAHLFAIASGGFVGVDRVALGRDRQHGARAEGGMRLAGDRAAFDLFAAGERRVDAYPTSHAPSSWLELGVRFGTR
jgi:hypothetical protein